MASHHNDHDDDEIEAIQALLALAISRSRHRPVTVSFPRWGFTKKRSAPKIEGVDRLSPSTPLLFGVDDTTPPATPPAVKIPTRADKEWVKEQKQRLATLSATKASFQQCLLEAKRRYQMLRETNSWLKELQAKLRVRRQQMHLYGGSSELERSMVGPACSVACRRQLDLNRRSPDEEAEERWRAAAARRWRRELQRNKFASAVKNRRLR